MKCTHCSQDIIGKPFWQSVCKECALATAVRHHIDECQVLLKTEHAPHVSHSRSGKNAA